MTKRVLSFLLVLVMLVGMLPVFVQAEETETAVDNGELTVEGTNGFGTLLAEDIAQEQESLEEQEASGYTLTALEITGNTATVTYDSLEEATVVVAVYTEDGMQLLTSGKTTVLPEETTATVTIEGEMPQYFLASAYLLDSYDMSPLCPAYDTPMYTQEMQELLASTAEDYDPDRVLQLEESPETNFAVYAETTKVIEQVEGVNTVVSVDDETNTYVIENADASITSLQVGDVFAYPYAEEEILIAKVAEITVDGTSVTITGADLEMDEAFSHVKLENTADTQDMTVDDSTAFEGVTYEGLIEGGNMARSTEGGGSLTAKHKYKFSVDEDYNKSYIDLEGSIEGSLQMELKVEFNYYISLKKQYLEFKITPSITASISIDASVTGYLPLGEFSVSPVSGVKIGFEPRLELKFTGKLELSFELSLVLGFRYENKKGFKNLSRKPGVDFSLDVEGTIFVGVDFHPQIKVLKKVAKVEATLLAGLEMTGKATGQNYEYISSDDAEKHMCKECLAIDLCFKAEISGKITFLNQKWLSASLTIGKYKLPIGKAYFSYDLSEFDFGSCPYKLYKVTITVEDTGENRISGASVTNGETDLGSTNSKGVLIAYLPEGLHSLCTVVGDAEVKKMVKVKEAVSVLLVPSISLADSILGSLDENDIVDRGTPLNTGAGESNISWALYKNGTVVINGTGPMDDWVLGSLSQNELSKIKSVYIADGITSIGDWAFGYCTNLVDIVIPDSVTNIGYYAFYDCGSLTAVTIPESVTEIEDVAFCHCTSLTDVIIPEGVTRLGQLTFYNCSSLTSIVIPKSVTTIADQVFDECSSLTDVYYGGTQEQWEAISIDSQNEGLTEVNIHYSVFSAFPETSSYMTVAYGTQIGSGTISGNMNGQLGVADAVYGGEYTEEITDTYIVKMASFTNLIPGKEYVLLAMASLEAEEPLGADNLLFVDQAAAAEDGSLSFRYIQRIDTDASYVMACGASNKDLANAQITFPEMIADGETQVVEPVVVYEGETLVDGQDYVITGDVDFTEAGEYTCYIRGIYNYTGLVTCTYQVRDVIQPALTLKYPTLSFEDEILLNIYYTASELEDVMDMGLITYSSEVSEWNVDNAESVISGYGYSEADGLYYATTEGIAAKDLSDTLWFAVYAELSDGSYVYTKLVSYSPKTYAYTQLTYGNESTKALVVAMLNYGAAAQTFFGYNTDALANSDLTADHLSLIQEYRADMMDTVATPSAAKQGAFANNGGYAKRYPTISFEGAFSINYYYTPSYAPVGDITMYYWNQADFDAADVLTAENATGAVLMNGEATSEYHAAVEGIAAKDLDKGIYVAFCYSDGTTGYASGVLAYSIGSYCVTQAGYETALQPFAQATAVYGYYAKQLFG